MLTTYLRSAWRTLQRNKLFSFINIFGLGLSMSLCLVILAHLRDQLSYDNFHQNPETLVRVLTELHDAEGREFRFASTPLPLGPQLGNNFDGAATIARIFPAGTQQLGQERNHLSLKTCFADPGLFHILNFRAVSGTLDGSLDAPSRLVLSRNAARKTFGNINPVGKTIDFGKLGTFLVMAVIDDSSAKSHVSYEAYISMSSLPALEKGQVLEPKSESWNNWSAGYTYIRLKDEGRIKQLDAALQQVARNLMSESQLKGSERVAFDIQRMDDIILGEDLLYAIGNTGSIGKTAAEIGIGFVILLSACFNYTNLSIARSLKRGREVGVRKVAGASRSQVFIQFLVESGMNTCLALVLSYVILQFLIRYAPFLAGSVSPDILFENPAIIGWFMVFGLFTALMAGVLPAWALSSFKPVDVLKNLNQVKLFGGLGLRKTLIVAQFGIAILIMIFASVFSRQFEYMSNADPGFNRENMLVLAVPQKDQSWFTQKLKQVNGVLAISAVSRTAGRGGDGKVQLSPGEGKDRIGADYMDVDTNFVSLSNLKILYGRQSRIPAGAAPESEIMINQTMARLLAGSGKPADIAGKQFLMNDSVNVTITGITSDFHYAGTSFPVWPLVLRSRPETFTRLQVQTASKSASIVAAAAAIWKEQYPAVPFESAWLKDQLYEQQSANDMQSTLGFLSLMASVIALLGLLGMVIYITQTREKEIGIRKIIGAETIDIIYLLSRNFMKLIMIAGLIAIPLSFIAGYFFLNMFAVRISSTLPSVITGFSTLLLPTLLIILSQVYRAAVSNPAQKLRAE